MINEHGEENHFEMKSAILPVQLTEDEIASRGEKLAALFQLLEQLKSDRSDEMQEWKKRIDDKQAEAHQLAIVITGGWEDRPVSTCTTFDYKRLTVTTTRTDTGEILNSRPMTEEERQRELPLNAKS